MAEKVYIDRSPTGMGVFAKVPLEPMERIFFVTGPLVTYETLMCRPDLGENAIQIGPARYIDPLYPARYLNHACEPNAGLADDIVVTALRQINPGEEIRFDYSTSMLERLWELECLCGCRACRGRVRDFDLLPEELQRHYLKLGIVQDFIVRSLIRQDESSPPAEVSLPMGAAKLF